MNGRDFVQMIAISPGFSGYRRGAIGSVNGARANQVNWQIDGTDNNDQWWNIMAVNQGGIQSIPGVLMPLDSVENSLSQRRLVGDGRNPRHINLVIKSGTNHSMAARTTTTATNSSPRSRPSHPRVLPKTSFATSTTASQRFSPWSRTAHSVF